MADSGFVPVRYDNCTIKAQFLITSTSAAKNLCKVLLFGVGLPHIS